MRLPVGIVMASRQSDLDREIQQQPNIGLKAIGSERLMGSSALMAVHGHHLGRRRWNRDSDRKQP